jgi:flagellar biosynthesis protein FlhG
MELMRSEKMDQAEGLRKIINTCPGKKGPLPPSPNRGRNSLVHWPRVISVGSGKGGVGKTNVVANLALAFIRMGKRVLVFDADLGLANIDVLLGLTPQYTIQHLLNGEKSVFEIITQGPGGMALLPASSGILEMVDLAESQKMVLLHELDLVAETVDILLIDTAAGISSNVLYFNMAAEESIVVVTPEPTSITDAYALIKVLSTKYKKENFTILVNSAQDGQEAKETFRKISLAVDRSLASISVDYLGFIPFDEKLHLAVKNQRPVLEIYPEAPSSRSFIEIARTLMERPTPMRPCGNIQFFWQHLFQCQQSLEKKGGRD